MLKYNNILFKNRKELKNYLGSDNSYNRCLKNKEIEFINSNTAIDEYRQFKKEYTS